MLSKLKGILGKGDDSGERKGLRATVRGAFSDRLGGATGRPASDRPTAGAAIPSAPTGPALAPIPPRAAPLAPIPPRAEPPPAPVPAPVAVVAAEPVVAPEPAPAPAPAVVPAPEPAAVPESVAVAPAVAPEPAPAPEPVASAVVTAPAAAPRPSLAAAAAAAVRSPDKLLHADTGSTDLEHYIARAKANNRDLASIRGGVGLNRADDGTPYWGPVDNESSRAKAAGKLLAIDQWECISCGTCVEQTETVFFLPADAKATPIAQDGPMDLIQDAIEACPVTCIHWVSDAEAADRGLATGNEPDSPRPV